MPQPESTTKETKFRADRLKRLAELERWHFWFAGRRELVMQLLRKHTSSKSQLVIDLGCGTGAMLDELNRLGYRSIGVDLLPDGLFTIQQGSPGLNLIQSNIQTLPLKGGLADGILLLDVLEHVDDHAALAETSRVLQPGGWLVISVPAIPWLWSYRDKAAGHRRRYTRKQLVEALRDANIEIHWMGYYQFFLFPLVILTRLTGKDNPGMRDREEVPFILLNAVLAWINRMEAKISRYLRLPWGSSLVAFCNKKGD